MRKSGWSLRLPGKDERRNLPIGEEIVSPVLA